MPHPKILIAPLDWGLGHAARCVPIINELVRNGCEVWIAGEGPSLEMLKKEFPALVFLHLTGYGIIYHNAKSNLQLTILKQTPAIIRRIKQEHLWLKNLLAEVQFDAVISDNRFGLYSQKTTCLFITHQLHIKTGMGRLADTILRKINYRYIHRFAACWVPDYKNPGVAGSLSGGGVLPDNVTYIGPLSRFKRKEEARKYDLLIILSGPEPRRSIWEQNLLMQLQSYGGKALLVRGLPGAKPLIPDHPVEIINYLPACELNKAIAQSDWVVCRSGYTSVMDLLHLRHKAILVPTPGQPEQEYLGKYLHEKKIFYSIREDSFSLAESIKHAAGFPYDFSIAGQEESNYSIHIARLLEQISARQSTSGSL